MKKHHRDHDLDRHLGGLLLGPLTPLDPDLLGLHPEHLADRDTEGIRLHHRADEGPDVRELGAIAHRPQRLGPAAADLHLLQDTRLNSPASGPSVFLATCWSAASKPRPASTEMVSRSMASASPRCISWSRLVAML